MSPRPLRARVTATARPARARFRGAARRSDPLPTRLPSLAEASRWGAGILVVTAGWAAGRGVAHGMDLGHAAAAGFAVSGSIFLALLLRGENGPLPARSR